MATDHNFKVKKGLDVLGGDVNLGDGFAYKIDGMTVVDSSRNLSNIGAITASGNVTISGNLTVNGTQTTLNTATLQVEDKNIVLNYGSGDTSGSATGAGITIQDAVNSTTDATILWNAAQSRFNISHTIVSSGNIESMGFLQHYGYLYSRTDLRVLNAAANGWNTWAARNNGNFDLNVGTISSGAITSTGSSVFTGSGSTGNAFNVLRGSDSESAIRVLNSGEVLIQSNYLYVNASEGAYIQTYLRVRGSIFNDTADTDLLLDDNVKVSGKTGLGVSPSTSNYLYINRVSGHPNIKSSDDYMLIDSNGGMAGLNWYSSDRVVLANGGGNVGIGSSGNHTQKLYVSGSVRSTSTIRADSGFDVNGTTVIDSSRIFKNVAGLGIGIAIPSKDFHVYTTANEGMFLQGTGNGVWMDVQSNLSELWSMGADNNGWAVYNRTDSAYRLRCENGGDVDIVSGGLKVGGNTVINASRDITARQATFTHTDHNYVKIENTSVAKEQMVRFRNSQTNYWYAGIRTSAGIASTADFHIYSTALGDDAFALTTSGDLVAKRNLNTKTGAVQINGTTVIDSSRNVAANSLTVSNGGVFSDSNFAFLTNASGAQNIRTKSVFAGTSYGDTPPAGSFNATNTYELNGTTVIDSSRNITAGAIASSGYITMNGDTKKYAAPVYRDNSGTSLNSSGFTTLFTVNGSALASTIRMTLAGTAGSVVVNVTADITVGHYQDILITSHSGFYTIVTLKVISDNNEDFAVQAKTNSTNSVTLAIEVFPLNNESVTFTTSHSFTGSSHEHTCHYGTHTSATGGNSGDLTVNGRTFLQDGSIASPALTFRNDHNTGIYRVGSDQIGWVSGGSRKFFTNASRAYFQNLSEGVDVPSLRLSGTTVLDSTRNLTNIGTISSGAIVSTSNITAGTGSQLFLTKVLTSSDFDAIRIAYTGSWSNFQEKLAGIHFVNQNNNTSTMGRIGITYGSGGGSFVVTDLYDGGFGLSGDVFRVRGNGNAEIQGSLTLGSTITTPKIEASGTGMSVFATNLGGGDDWQNSPITIRERGAGSSTSNTSDSYAPNLNFHWAPFTSRSIWMRQDGTFNFGEYSSSGVGSATANLSPLNADSYKILNTTVINSSREVNNVTLRGLSTGARLEHGQWHQSSDGYNRFYFANASHTYFRTGSAFVFRDNGDTGRATISSNGGLNLRSGGDGFVGNTVALAVSGITVIDSSRNVTANSLGVNKSSPVGRLDVHQTLDAPAMCITSSNPSQWGAALLIGNTVADQTLVDSNDRPMLVLDGKYPVLNLNHSVTSNDNHGPTIQFTCDGYNSSRQWVIGTDGQANRMDFGVSGGTAGTNTNKNPHNGISGHAGKTVMRLFENGVLLGSTGVYPNEITSVSNALEVVGNIKCTESILKTNYNEAVLLSASGNSSSGSAIGFQQATTEGWTGIFVDFNPYEGWGLYHDNPSNYFYITAESTVGSLGTSFTVPNRNSGSSTAYAKIRFDQNNGNINAGGAITAQGNVTAYASDRRLKTNFRQIESAVDKVKKLNGMIFDWNDVADANGFMPDRKHDDIGLIAQEVQEIVPQAVELAPFDTEVISTPITKGDKNGGNIEEKRSISGEDYLTVNYSKLVPLLVNAIKEQADELAELKGIIKEMKNGNY